MAEEAEGEGSVLGELRGVGEGNGGRVRVVDELEVFIGCRVTVSVILQCASSVGAVEEERRGKEGGEREEENASCRYL